MPSGFGDESDTVAFRADTFRHGRFQAQSQDLQGALAGCIRYLDIGFFDEFRESPMQNDCEFVAG